MKKITENMVLIFFISLMLPLLIENRFTFYSCIIVSIVSAGCLIVILSLEIIKQIRNLK